jgi:hypothetical protein
MQQGNKQQVDLRCRSLTRTIANVLALFPSNCIPVNERCKLEVQRFCMFVEEDDWIWMSDVVTSSYWHDWHQ